VYKADARLFSSTTEVSLRAPTPVQTPTNPRYVSYKTHCLRTMLMAAWRILAVLHHICQAAFVRREIHNLRTVRASSNVKEVRVLTVMLCVVIRVIDGSDTTLESMEKVPVNPKNRPLHEIKLESVSCCSTGVAQTTDYNLVIDQVTIHANPIAEASK